MKGEQIAIPNFIYVKILPKTYNQLSLLSTLILMSI